MKKVIVACLSLAAVSSSAHAEFYPLNIWRRGVAAVLGSYYGERAQTQLPIVRSRRVPLLNVQPCESEDACVILNGEKKVLKATPGDLLHGKVQVVGTSKENGYTGVYARVRFGSWASSEPDYLLVWAAIRERRTRVKILGYSVQRDDEPGVESDDLKRVTNVGFYKFLTTHNPIETEIARELTERNFFCLKHPADPSTLVRDEAAKLHARNLAADERAEQRLSELNATASLVNPEIGRSKCESPITDQMDILLDQVRAELDGFLPAPPPVVAPKPIPAPAPVPSAPAVVNTPTPTAPNASSPSAPVAAPVPPPTPDPAPVAPPKAEAPAKADATPAAPAPDAVPGLSADPLTPRS